MSEIVVKVNNIFRSFGSIHAVDGLSFEILRGQSIGFIGANGAGKTTTMRMLSTLDIPDRGTIEMFGMDAFEHAREVRRKVGWMPDAYGTYESVTVFDYLDFFARAYGYSGNQRRQKVRTIMEFTDLTPLAERLMATLSKGMGQRLCLARALINDPEILILDEPAAGLDPKARVEFKHLVRLLAGEGRSIFISSHILSELEDMCDTLLFIDQGKLVHHGSAKTLKRGVTDETLLDIKTSGDIPKLEEALALEEGVKVLEGIKGGVRAAVSSREPAQISALLKRLIDAGLPVYEFHEHERRLEDAFIEMVEKGKIQ
jgi:ABC-2 type transport system ATP-binding protein